MAPIIVIALTPLILKEKLDWRKIPCIIAAVIGIVLVSGIIGGGITGPAGVVFGLLGACCFAGIVFCNRKLKDISAFDRALVQLAVSALTILPYVLVKNRGIPLPKDLKSGLIVLMLGVLQTGVAYVLYFSGMGKLPVQSVAILGYRTCRIGIVLRDLPARTPRMVRLDRSRADIVRSDRQRIDTAQNCRQ